MHFHIHNYSLFYGLAPRPLLNTLMQLYTIYIYLYCYAVQSQDINTNTAQKCTNLHLTYQNFYELLKYSDLEENEWVQ